MPDLHPYQYAIMRVVPDQVRNEAKNVGVVLHDWQTKRCEVKVTKNVHKLRTYAQRNLDVNSLDRVLEAIESGLEESGSIENLIQVVTGAYRHQVQFAGPFGGLTADVEEELEDLYDRLISIDTLGVHRPTSLSRRRLRKVTREAFVAERVQVEPRKTLKGAADRFRFDFKAGGHRQAYVQCLAVGEEAGFDDAKALAYSIDDIRQAETTGAHQHEFAAVVTLAPALQEDIGRVEAILKNRAEVVSEDRVRALATKLR